MKKIFLSSFVVVSFLLYGSIQQNSDSAVHTTASGSAQNTSGSTSADGSSPGPSGTPPQKLKKTYKDGVYTGDSADAFYGNVKVRAKIINGQIQSIDFIEYPNDRPRSVAINTQAMPYLKEEAIQAQNANVDIVSGATDTSQAFTASLQSALNKAQN